MSEWISVEDRLPEMIDRYGLCSGKVLIAQGVVNKHITFGWYRRHEWITSNNFPFARQDLITHWMPMPEPPGRAQTNRDRLTASSETLAETLVYPAFNDLCGEGPWMTHSGDLCVSKDEAIKYTVDWLDSPAETEGDDSHV